MEELLRDNMGGEPQVKGSFLSLAGERCQIF